MANGNCLRIFLLAFILSLGYCIVSPGYCILSLNYCNAESLMKFDKLTYTVAEMMGPPQELTIKPDGEARYESHSNNSMPDTPEIGFYQMKLPAAEVEKLSRSLDNPPFQDLPDHRGRIVAGDRYKRIIISTGSSTIEKMTGTTEPVDPGLARLIGHLDQVVAELIRHPKRALRMELLHVAISDSGTVTMDFKLSGAGTEVTDCVNPVTLAGSAGLSIRGWPEKPPSEFSAGQAFGVNVDKVTELGKLPKDTATTVFIRIAPGQGISFRATARLSVPSPEVYLIQLSYQNTTEHPDGPPVMIGELFSKITKLKIPTIKP
jgi:hypothetical protein